MKYLLLNQLGTPNSPEPTDVGNYLKEFLMDPQVIGLPRPFLDILVKLIIVPRRKYSSSEKYKKVWTNEGSPLAVNTELLRKKLETYLGENWKVLTGMRYGQPSIAEALTKINAKSDDLLIYLPLYPQYADATVGSAINKFNLEIRKNNIKTNVEIIEPFYNQNWYLEALAESIRPNLKPTEHLLLSYHGIPLSQEKKAKASYFQHCMSTSEYLKKTFKLNDQQMSTSFQSRVGLAKWLEPSTEATAIKLAQAGVKHLKVACPSFVADCLETIEEIGMELRHTFMETGGESFELVPCLNGDEKFIAGLANYLKSF